MHALTGKKLTEDHKFKIGLANRGKKRTSEEKLFISQKTKIAMAKSELRMKLSQLKIGSVPWNKGKKIQSNTGRTHFKKGQISLKKRTKASPELRFKSSVAHGGNGNSTSPYGIEFDNNLKRKIFERDNFKCADCKKNHPLICHHIDQNKQNNNEYNLTTLCRSCHSKVHKYYLRLRKGY